MNAGSVFNKTRLAPTPSGYLHLGNVYSFALTAALARKTGASIFLRIDDMDRERTERAYLEDIFNTLGFLQIPFDEGPRSAEEFEQRFSQLHRLGLYNELLHQLAEKGLVYACRCSRADILRNSADGVYPGTCRHQDIPLDAADVSWRLNTSQRLPLKVKALHGTLSATLPAGMQDFVVRKKDGHPAYQLSSVADDVYFGVDLVVRGQDLWHSTLAQLYIAALLQLDAFSGCTFHHHGLLTGPGGNKLSKSAGDTSVQYLVKQGRSREEIYQLLGRQAGLALGLRSWHDLSEAL